MVPWPKLAGGVLREQWQSHFEGRHVAHGPHVAHHSSDQSDDYYPAQVQSNPNISEADPTKQVPGFVVPIRIRRHLPANISHTSPVYLFEIEGTNRAVVAANGLPYNVNPADIPAGANNSRFPFRTASKHKIPDTRTTTTAASARCPAAFRCSKTACSWAELACFSRAPMAMPTSSRTSNSLIRSRPHCSARTAFWRYCPYGWLLLRLAAVVA